MLTYGSVCSGIEAASVAWHPLGWRAAFVSEIEPFPRAVLAERFPETPLHGDFTTICAGDYEPIDLLVGGTPCQSFSIAGLRGGMADERGNLALEYLRLAGRLGPRWLVWENVPGVLSSNGGRDFGSILGGLVELGYGFSYRVLDAQYFGVPQRRRRVFVVGYLGDWCPAAAVLFERASLRRDPAPGREAREGVAGGAAYGISADCFDRSGEGAGGSAGERSGLGVEEGLAQTLRAKRPGAVAFGLIGNGEYADRPASLRAEGGDCGGGSEHLVTHTLRAEGFDASEDGTGRGIPLVPMPFDTTQIASPTSRSRVRPGDPCHTLSSGAHPPAIAFDARQQDVLQYGDRSGPLDTDGWTIGVSQADAVRRLTPRECERLQGFPDDFTLVRYRNKPAADGPRYRALGNSMAVPVMAWIGSRIATVETLLMEQAA